eukprot:CAMPEP_0119367902 /NCGR_PEP_ID=MMETSP1334-20130426/14629_1 /TAXON_ID=127549 /ORGANISM="Calcidiscus leptoporus, Strain RCC1130" /LENGTH=356 /DNA_ID=CAMNT_0007384421 /DNA_START=39 /DNA_END=1109 /DNA_ORIENTATION=+
MNSLLQSLHHLPEFRRLVYEIGTSGDVPAGSSIALELQRIFYMLQHGVLAGVPAVGTELLTDAFGWGWREVNEQQDVQEFWHMLYDALQTASSAERGAGGGSGARLASLFEGRVLNYVRCTRVPFRSEREEIFCDLQMQVSGCRSLHDSFAQFAREQRLDGDNCYNTRDERYGRQEARRGAAFKSLPPILQLHLKRFEYEPSTGAMHKLQQAFRFPTTLRLRKFMVRGDASPTPVYKLHAVLSHQGTASSGHYVSYVRPGNGNKWYKFDDTRVSEVPEHAAVVEQFGGEYGRPGGIFGFGEVPSAYMLTYVRQADGNAAGVETSGEELPAVVREAFKQDLNLYDDISRQWGSRPKS